jgi:hypothetical protein
VASGKTASKLGLRVLLPVLLVAPIPAPVISLMSEIIGKIRDRDAHF